MQITIRDIAYSRFSAPDLDTMRNFLIDFGMTAVAQSDSRLWMRGCGSAPFLHVTEHGEPGYRGFGFEAESLEALHELAAQEGAPLQQMGDAPGGGAFIRLRDPDGFDVDVVAGQSHFEPLPAPLSQAWNTSGIFARGPMPRRVAAAPSTVVRLGHVVHIVSNVDRTWEWYASRFRLAISDDVVAPDQKRVALFIRLNRGDEPSDHHTLNFGEVPSGRTSFHHAAYEVLDFDDLMVGNEHLKAREHKQVWGIGRHILGSQVFDYWTDPWGHVLEHWTDGDRFDAHEPTHVTDIETMVGRQWGPEAPSEMIS